MENTKAAVLKKFYSDLLNGDYQSMLNASADAFTFQVPGKSTLAGKYNKSNFVSGFLSKLNTLSQNTYKLEVHDILASNLHGTVLVSSKITRGTETVELRSVHIWRFEGDKPLAGYEYPRDLYLFDSIWA